VDLRLCFSMLIRRDIERNSSDLGWAAIATKLGSFCKFAIEGNPPVRRLILAPRLFPRPSFSSDGAFVAAPPRAAAVLVDELISAICNSLISKRFLISFSGAKTLGLK